MRKIALAGLLILAFGSAHATIVNLTYQVNVTSRSTYQVNGAGNGLSLTSDPTFTAQIMTFGVQFDTSVQQSGGPYNSGSNRYAYTFFDQDGVSWTGLDANAQALMAELTTAANFPSTPFSYSDVLQQDHYNANSSDYVLTRTYTQDSTFSNVVSSGRNYTSSHEDILNITGYAYGEPDTPGEVFVPTETSLLAALYNALANGTPLSFGGVGRAFDYNYPVAGGTTAYTAASGVSYYGTAILTSVQPVPLPAAAWLLLSGLGGLGLMGRRRKAA